MLVGPVSATGWDNFATIIIVKNELEGWFYEDVFDSETFISTFFEENGIQKTKLYVLHQFFMLQIQSSCYKIITFFLRQKK